MIGRTSPNRFTWKSVTLGENESDISLDYLLKQTHLNDRIKRPSMNLSQTICVLDLKEMLKTEADVDKRTYVID